MEENHAYVTLEKTISGYGYIQKEEQEEKGPNNSDVQKAVDASKAAGDVDESEGPSNKVRKDSNEIQHSALYMSECICERKKGRRRER